MTESVIAEKLLENGIPFAPALPAMLKRYMDMLLEWNSRMDLTAVTDEAEILDKHLVDSLSVLKTDWLFREARLIDVGTGAGLPGLLLAMARPDLRVTLLDALKKRLGFLQAVCDDLGLQGVQIIHARAEDGARQKDMREAFDVAAARAVAPLNVLCEYLLPYVAPGGLALCWKGPALETELSAGRKAAHVLGGRLEMPFSVTIAGREWGHRILPVRKVQRTPNTYPRKAGMPKGHPLA